MIEYDEDDHTTAIAKATHELKRVDHLIYVSLKYTRTVDVIKNIIHRLINCYDYIFNDLILFLHEDGKIFDIPTAPGLKSKILKQYYGHDDELMEFIQFYTLLRLLYKSEYKALREFRRHVTMEAHLPTGEEIEVNIDVIGEYYARTKAFMNFVKQKYMAQLVGV